MVTSDTSLQAILQNLYGGVDDVDPFIGALAEGNKFT
jgi:hypothetical protein